MRTSLLIGSLVFAAAASGVFAQNKSQSRDGQEVTLNVESDARILAEGYAASLGSLIRPPFSLTLQRENKTYLIDDVRSLRANNGLLIVEAGRGEFYVINAKDVIALSDSKPLALRQVP